MSLFMRRGLGLESSLYRLTSKVHALIFLQFFCLIFQKIMFRFWEFAKTQTRDLESFDFCGYSLVISLIIQRWVVVLSFRWMRILIMGIINVFVYSWFFHLTSFYLELVEVTVVNSAQYKMVNDHTTAFLDFKGCEWNLYPILFH